MRRALSTLGACVAILGAAVALPAAAAGQGVNQTPNQNYVAMGDSYSSGNGTGDYYESNCSRSTKAYGPLIDPQIPGTFSHPACSGARTPHIDQSSQNGFPPQIDLLGPNTKYVSLTIGGNDAGFVDALTDCANPFGNCTGSGDSLDQAQAFIQNQLPALLDRNYAAIRQRAPNATVTVLGYPRIFRPNASCILVFSEAEVNRANQLADQMADVTRARALAAGFSFVDSRQPFIGHGSCDSANWINEFSVSDTVGSFHPTANGYVSFGGTVRSTLLAAPRPGQTRGPNGRLAFSSDRGGNFDVWVVNGNGEHPVNVTQSPGADTDPAWSPDGTKLAFASDRDGDNEIYVQDFATGAVTKLTSNAFDDREPAWSPNGDLIAFQTNRDGNAEIYTMDASGSALARLTNNAAADGAPAWSPDGSEIAFQRIVSGSNNDVFRMNSDGQGQLNLTNRTTSNDAAPQWSPDGASIVFQSNRDGNADIYTMSRAGATQTRRTTTAGDDTEPSYSPNGASIVFTSARDGDPEIYAMAANGSSPARRTASAGPDLSPSWQGDATPPKTTIDTGPSGSIASRQPELTFHADEPGSTFACKVDGGTFSACSSPFTTPVLANGPHTVQVRSTDPSGNVEASPPSRSFTVDVPVDSTSIVSAPSGTTRERSPQFEFGSGVSGTAFECRIDGGEFASCVSPWTPPAPLGDGEHTFQVRGTPPGGETGAPVSSTFTVDATPPETTIDVAPPASGNEPRPAFEFSSEDGATFECRLDSSSEDDWSPCDSPHRPGEPLNDGPHRLEVRATDEAGNTETTPAASEFNVDTEAPVTTLGPVPPERITTATASFDFSSEPGARFECRFDSGDEADWVPCTAPVVREGLSDGPHTFGVRAIDAAGNVEAAPRSVSFAVDANAPGTEIDSGPAPGSFIADRSPAFAFSSEDPEARFECRLDSGLEAAWMPCDQTWQGSDLSEGPHSFEVRAIDAFDNVDATPARRDFTIDVTAPVTAISAGPQGKTNAAVLSAFVFAAGEEASYECRLDDADWEPCTSPHAVTVAADGERVFAVRATDRAGNAETTPATRSFDLRRAVPDTRITSGPSGPTNSTPEFGFDSPGFADAVFECSIGAPGSPGPWQSCETGRSYEALADGDYRFQVRARDAYGNVDQTPAVRDFSRDTVAPTVQIGAGFGGFIRSSSVQVPFNAGDATTVACRLDAGEWEPCTAPRQLTGLSDGPHAFAVRGTDAAGNSSTDSRSFAVDTVAPQTTITSGPQGATADSSPAFEFESEPGATFECSLDGSDWDDCDSPHELGPLTEGPHTFEVRATDGAGNPEAQPVRRRFTVDTTAPDTTITGGPSGSTRDAAPAFTFTATEPGVSFACRVDAGEFAPCRSGAPLTGLADGAHVIAVRATDEAGNSDPDPASRSFTIDTRVEEPAVSVPATVKVKGGKLKLPVTVSAGEAARVDAVGKVVAARKRLKLRPTSRQVLSRARSTLLVGMGSRRSSKRLGAALAAGKRAKAKVTVTFTDGLGNQVVVKRVVKLAGKAR